MKNNYGNYVVQSALKLATEDFRDKLTNNMLDNIDRIKDKKLISKWKIIIDESYGSTKRTSDKKSASEKISVNPKKRDIENISYSGDIRKKITEKEAKNDPKAKSNVDLFKDIGEMEMKFDDLTFNDETGVYEQCNKTYNNKKFNNNKNQSQTYFTNKNYSKVYRGGKY